MIAKEKILLVIFLFLSQYEFVDEGLGFLLYKHKEYSGFAAHDWLTS